MGTPATSTPEFLATLDLHQLRYAVELADRLIKEKEREEKAVIWVVSDRFVNLKVFGKSEYLKAAEFLLEQAREKIGPGRFEPDPREMELELKPHFVPLSELKDWMA